ncbi:MAG: GNAT family N-acetyltransferase [Propionibacteriaceae bacterium]
MAIVTRPERLDADRLIRPARPGEEDLVLDLLSEASAWLRSRGIDQWPPRFPVASVRHQISAGEALLVAGPDARPVATVAVAESDPDVWAGWDGSAFFVSRLAVTRRASGADLGYTILDWVAGRAAARGRDYVRLATARDNSALRRYYELAGFTHVADPTHANWPTSLYERPVDPSHQERIRVP